MASVKRMERWSCNPARLQLERQGHVVRGRGSAPTVQSCWRRDRESTALAFSEEVFFENVFSEEVTGCSCTEDGAWIIARCLDHASFNPSRPSVDAMAVVLQVPLLSLSLMNIREDLTS